MSSIGLFISLRATVSGRNGGKISNLAQGLSSTATDMRLFIAQSYCQGRHDGRISNLAQGLNNSPTDIPVFIAQSYYQGRHGGRIGNLA